MSAAAARKGDPISHGGMITSGASKWKFDGLPVARKGDTVNCAIHGPQTIIAGSAKWNCEGHPIARVGDACSCGATIISGSPKWTVA